MICCKNVVDVAFLFFENIWVKKCVKIHVMLFKQQKISKRKVDQINNFICLSYKKKKIIC